MKKDTIIMKCTPHIRKIEWEVESASIDLNTNTMNINLFGRQIIDYLDMEIIIK